MGRKYYEDFSRYSRYDGDIQYQWARNGFFKNTPAKWYRMLFYEEEGRFYELLTGTYLGIRKNLDHEYVYSDEFGYCISLSGYSVSQYANEVTSEKFAGLAKMYMQDKEQILPHLNRRFDEWRSENQKRIAEEIEKQRKQEEKNRTDKENVNWLDDLLSGRK